MKNKKLEFVIIGSGNVAWHLAKKISSFKRHTLSVYNHQNNSTLEKIKFKFSCEVFSNLNNISKTADYYFICVSDKAITSVVKKINILNPKGILMHTSGSLPLKILGTHCKNRAVFYPLQTFSKQDKLKWSNSPIIIEANNAEVLKEVRLLAKLFSEKIIELADKERLQLHLAAVLVNNFTNAMYVEAFKLLPKNNEANYDLLLPLMKQSVSKLGKVHPLNAQTGPAKRHDTEVMKKHLDLIGKNKVLKHVYEMMSELIMLQQKN